MIEPKTFRKKPVEIQAMRWPVTADMNQALAVSGWMNREGYPWIEENDLIDRGIWIKPETFHLVIRTLEGDMFASPGDWIIRGVQGEFYPCKPYIFSQTYEEHTNDQ